MKVDVLSTAALHEWPDVARRVEDTGYDGVVSPEFCHDPFLPLALAATATERIDLVTGIVVAFARTPMTVAMAAADLHRLSGGRLILGLGSQVRAHITRRYSMPWSRPAARMREFVLALRAIWDAWDGTGPMAFEGEFYRHTLMTPVFDQGPSAVGQPAVFVAAVGPAMTEVAGEVADGLMLHGFTTASYVREVTLPHLERGLAAAGRSRADVAVTLPMMPAVTASEEHRATAIAQTRAHLAFYGSTPAYRPVLEHHGWGDLGAELHRLSKQGDWSTMAELIDDDVIDAFSVVAETPEAAGEELGRRYGGLVDRIQVPDDRARPELLLGLRDIQEHVT